MVIYLLRTLGCLHHMLREMDRKNLDLHRLTKTAGVLMSIGVSPKSIPPTIATRCLQEQQPDGGWVGICDTMWNLYFLLQYDPTKYQKEILQGLDYLKAKRTSEGLWGHSERDRHRIPVSGMMFYLLPQLATSESLYLLERLWLNEKNTLTYKAAYVLMGMGKCSYIPRESRLLEETVHWLIANQRDDGSFAPWKNHPVASDVVYTSIAVLGLLQYPHWVPIEVLQKASHWLQTRQLPSGIWPYHEIEHGASWGLWALSQLAAFFGKKSP